jgi:hypothetical protein
MHTQHSNRLVYSEFFLLLLLHCFIFTLVMSLCCVSRSSLYCNIPSDLCTLCLSCYYFCYTPSLSTPILQDFVKFRNSKKNVLKIGLIIVNINKDENKSLILLLYCFIFIVVLSLCCVSRSSLYCNIPLTDVCTLCLSINKDENKSLISNNSLLKMICDRF